MPDDNLEDVRLLTIADFDRKSPFGLILAGHAVLDDALTCAVHLELKSRSNASSTARFERAA